VRSPDGLRRMKEFMSVKRAQWNTSRDFILNRFFGSEYETDPLTSRFAIVPNTHKYRVYFVPNDFPYHVEDGIEHWILWSLDEMSSEEAKRFLDAKLIGPEGQFLEYVYFVNPPAIQSIPDVFHFQVFYKKHAS